jgi:hypothetical protein
MECTRGGKEILHIWPTVLHNLMTDKVMGTGRSCFRVSIRVTEQIMESEAAEEPLSCMLEVWEENHREMCLPTEWQGQLRDPCRTVSASTDHIECSIGVYTKSTTITQSTFKYTDSSHPVIFFL